MSLIAARPDDGNAAAALTADAPAGGAGLAAPCAAVAPSDRAPLVDPAALQDLGEQLNSAAVAKGFARDFAQLWGRRYASLATALSGRDQTAALDAVLSLKTSSSMVGGLRLAELAAELEEMIRAGKLELAASFLGDVAARGSDTVDELQFSSILREC
ncbi:Hpt domain-containing protein [Arthrobacter sp. UYEF3]|uniref:Hpt domain-containing protein n=1 Tax=Arthrobacter sp. UYEF3 TaxID=1756365 RepID=UPI003397EF12